MANNSMKLNLNETDMVDNASERRFLVFTINGQSMAIEIDYVKEIIEVLPIVRVPSIPTCIKGVVNLRGSIVPVINLRLRFGYGEAEYDEHTCIIVIENNGVNVGLIVDSVTEILNISIDKIMDPSKNELSAQAQFIKGVGCSDNKVNLILDCDKVLDLQSF